MSSLRQVIYNHKQSLRVHVRAVHQKGFQCVVCNKAMLTKTALESHMNGHLQKKPFSCDTCQKTYQSKGGFAQHSCSGKSSSFKCDECNKLCPTSEALKQHKLLHDPMPQFSCLFCVQFSNLTLTLVQVKAKHLILC